MVIRIDCETRETALNTIASFYKITPSEIDSFFANSDLEEICLKNWRLNSADKIVRMVFEEKFGSPKDEIQEVCWFHLTRTLPGNRFKEGILPLNKALELVWNTLFTIFRDTEHYSKLRYQKEHGGGDFHYNNKTSDESQYGPFAMLIKDAAFHASSIGNHDYLWLPEIVEDICNGYETSFKIRLHETVVSSLKPCIVKFISNKKIDNELFDPIIYYLYLTDKGESMRIDSNSCFNGSGCLIGADNILKIEFLA